METWIIYALLSILFGGLFNFGLKIVAERNYDVNYVSFLSYILLATFTGINFFSKNSLETSLDGVLMMLGIGLITRLCFFLSTITRVEGLKYIDTTIFFPLYKTLFPLMAALVGVFIFSESLSTKEMIGVVVGISVPLLLITKRENSIQKNIKYGIIFMILTSVFILISTIAFKYIIQGGYNLDFYIFLSAFIGVLMSYGTYITSKRYSKKVYSTKGIYLFSLLIGICHFGSMLFFAYALTGNMAIVVTIDSFSVLIPIILSVIFYKEEMTKKKAFVIFLSIVSVILFI